MEKAHVSFFSKREHAFHRRRRHDEEETTPFICIIHVHIDTTFSMVLEALETTTMMLRLSVLSLLLNASVTAQQCMTQDFTLSACLESTDISEAQQAECNACIVNVANNPVVKGAISNFCNVANAAACESIQEDCTACGNCTAPAVEKGQCEIDAARSK